MSFYLPNKLFFYTKNKKKISISLFYKLVVFPIDSVTRKPRHKGIYIMWTLCHMTFNLLWCYNLIILFTVGESMYKHKLLSWNCLRWILSSLSYSMSLKIPMFGNEISKANNKILVIIKLCMCLAVSWKYHFTYSLNVNLLIFHKNMCLC